MVVWDTPPLRQLPPIDDVSRGYWTGGSRGELVITRCMACSRFIHPPAATCPECDAATRPGPVRGDGVVFSYTISHHQFHPAVPTPFVIAIVELDAQPGLRIVSNVVGCEPNSVHIGMRVTARFEKHGEVYAPIFVPAAAATSWAGGRVPSVM